jgi:peptide/nickel transport system permease protein
VGLAHARGPVARVGQEGDGTRIIRRPQWWWPQAPPPAVAIGASRWLILRRYILPMSYTPVLVNATMDFGQVVLLTASLSFIGLGARPPSAEWGAMMVEGKTNFYQWWIAAAPGVAILLVVLAFNFIGDGLRDTFDVRDNG